MSVQDPQLLDSDEVKSELSSCNLKHVQNLLDLRSLLKSRGDLLEKEDILINILLQRSLEKNRITLAQKNDHMKNWKADLKMARQEIAKLRHESEEFDSVIKSLMVGLSKPADNTLRAALEMAFMVDDFLYKNHEMIEMNQVADEEKLEEPVLPGRGQNHLALNEELKNLDREVACANVTAHRLETMVHAELKDSNDKLMKEKYQLLLRVLEYTLRSPNHIYHIGSSDGKIMKSLGRAEVSTPLRSDGFLHKRSLSFQCMRSALSAGPCSALKHARSKSFDGCSRSLNRSKPTYNLGLSCEEILIKKPDEKLSALLNDKNDAI